MNLAESILSVYWPPAFVVIIALLLGYLAHWIAKRSQRGTSGILYQLSNWLLASFAVITIVVLLPLSGETRGQVLSLLGVVLTAILALAATTFVTNMIAGIMLQASQPFRPGDYVRVNDQFGRVTKSSLFHTQIQTEWRDLTNLPNLMLVNNPVTVMHRDGTIIHAEISIGYDVTYLRVEELLLQAGADAGLREPFVLVHELLDHAVVYRICGFLPEMNHLLSSRSNLRKKVLEQMHGNGVEIVSPSFMNQRALNPEKKIIPPMPVMHDADKPLEASKAPEDMIFDKAEEAASIEELKLKQEETHSELKKMRSKLKAANDDDAPSLLQKIEQLEKRQAWYERLVEQQKNGD
jgi:small conductance mechanosensitive channel